MTRTAKAVQMLVFVFAAFGFTVAVMLVAAVGYSQWERRNLFYPNVGNESAFIQNYTPQPALMPFVGKYVWTMSGPSISGSTGHGFAAHEDTIQMAFAVRTDQ